MIIRGEFGALAHEAGRLDDIGDRIDGRLARERADMEEFLGAGWTGASASQFRAAIDRWDAAATECAADLHRLVDAIRAATADLVAGEQANTEVTEVLADSIPPSLARMMGAR